MAVLFGFDHLDYRNFSHVFNSLSCLILCSEKLFIVGMQLHKASFYRYPFRTEEGEAEVILSLIVKYLHFIISLPMALSLPRVFLATLS